MKFRKKFFLVLLTLSACGSASSSSESPKATESAQIVEDITTTTNQIGPTWSTKTPGDVFIAPFAQSVCDIIRTWQPPAETTSERASLLEKANSDLFESILSNSESETYLNLLVNSESLLEFGQKNPQASKHPISKVNLEFECDYYGFTTENSKFGA